jgi:hypothetical protein
MKLGSWEAGKQIWLLGLIELLEFIGFNKILNNQMDVHEIINCQIHFMNR